MDSHTILVGIAAMVALAVGCQLIAPWLRLPALVLLLPVGFLGGILIPEMDPEAIFGDLFSPLINIAVALILFHGGMELAEERLVRQDRRVINLLVFVGALLTFAVATGLVLFFFDINPNIAVLAGAILIVSGPTVVGPLLSFVNPTARVRRILAWEGTLIDPVGALIAVIMLQGVQASDEGSVGTAVKVFAVSCGIGIVTAAIGLALMWVGLKLSRTNQVLGTEAMLGAVIVGAVAADILAEDAGLVTAVIMGVVAPWMARRNIHELKPFFDTVINVTIGVLFISISAMVTPSEVQAVLLPALGVVVVLVVVWRPLQAWLLTYRSGLTGRERLFMGWMAPRGIVAAATASSFSASLVALGIDGADVLLPLIFVVIVGTVVIYSLTAVPVASLLGVRQGPAEPIAEPLDDLAPIVGTAEVSATKVATDEPPAE